LKSIPVIYFEGQIKRKPIIAGNWKLNKTPNETIVFLEEIKPLLAGVDDVKILVCPTFTSLNVATYLTKKTNIKIGAQNLYWEKSGAFTGEVSGDMIKELAVNTSLSVTRSAANILVKLIRPLTKEFLLRLLPDWFLSCVSVKPCKNVKRGK
jgi:hypothetical protein